MSPRRPTSVAFFACMASLVLASKALADAPDVCADAAARAGREGSGGLARPSDVDLPGLRANAENPATTEPAAWRGPRVDLGYVLYDLPDGWGGGLVQAGSLAGYLPTGHLRLGVYVDGGVRDYALGPDDAVLRATLFAGYQDLGRISGFLPYLVGTVTGGVLVGKRFSTTIVDGMAGVGVEAGAEVNPIRSLHMGVALGATWLTMDGLHYGTWTFRVFVGL